MVGMSMGMGSGCILYFTDRYDQLAINVAVAEAEVLAVAQGGAVQGDGGRQVRALQLLLQQQRHQQ